MTEVLSYNSPTATNGSPLMWFEMLSNPREYSRRLFCPEATDDSNGIPASSFWHRHSERTSPEPAA